MQAQPAIDFRININVMELPHELIVRKHPETDGRYEVKSKKNDFSFTLVRSAIGQWIISGENVPDEIVAQGQQIGKLCEAYNEE